MELKGKATKVLFGSNHILALTEGGELYSMGNSNKGALGIFN